MKIFTFVFNAKINKPKPESKSKQNLITVLIQHNKIKTTKTAFYNISQIVINVITVLQ